MSKRKKLRTKMNATEKRYVRKKVRPALQGYNLESWQSACTSFGPFNYNETTRKQWYEKYKSRVTEAKRIVDFVNRMAKELRKDKKLEDVSMKAIRSEIVEAIREMQKKEGIEKNKLNSFKIAAFKTLIRFAENPSLLEEGPYEGRKTLPPDMKPKPKISRRGRKKEKGEFGPPLVNLTKDVELIGSKQIRITIEITNNFLHPYQHVTLELDIDPKLSLKSVKPYIWKPNENQVSIGFLEAGLEVDPLETEVQILFDIKKKGKSYSISGTLFYDDTDKGTHAEIEIPKESIKI